MILPLSYFILHIMVNVVSIENSVDISALLYTDICSVNSSESLNRIRDAPIVQYKFIYDSVQDRKQLGIIGSDAQRLFPESIEVIPNKIITSKDKTKARHGKL